MYFYQKFIMDYSLDITRKGRVILDKFLTEIPLELLNKVPKGFNNNIFWNIKHVVVTQQLLVYNLSELPMQLTADEVAAYRKGSKAEGPVDAQAVELLRDQLFTTLDKTHADYNKGLFNRYNDYTVSTGTTLTSVDDALEFNNFHEGIHLGYILALKRSLGI